MATKPSAAQIKAATAKVDPVAVTSAVINETPELAEPLLARGAILIPIGISSPSK